MKAHAVVFESKNKVVYRAVNCPEPGESDVVIDVEHSWISPGTEGSFLRGERSEGDVAWRPGAPDPFPLVAGYQKVGTLRKVGSRVEGLRPGDRVFATMSRVEGMYKAMGGHVSPAVTPACESWKLPAGDALPYSGLVLAQVGYNCGARPTLSVGAGAIVVGDGLVGLWAAQTLAWRKARVLLVGRHAGRLARVKGPGCQVVNAKEEDWVEAAKRFFPDGVPALVDTVGDISLVETYLKLARRCGEFISAGFYGTADQVSAQALRAKELGLITVSGWVRKRMDETLALVQSGALSTAPLITHRFPVAKAAEAWDTIRGDRDKALGVILDWA